MKFASMAAKKVTFRVSGVVGTHSTGLPSYGRSMSLWTVLRSTKLAKWCSPAAPLLDSNMHVLRDVPEIFSDDADGEQLVAHVLSSEARGRDRRQRIWRAAIPRMHWCRAPQMVTTQRRQRRHTRVQIQPGQ